MLLCNQLHIVSHGMYKYFTTCCYMNKHLRFDEKPLYFEVFEVLGICKKHVQPVYANFV